MRTAFLPALLCSFACSLASSLAAEQGPREILHQVTSEVMDSVSRLPQFASTVTMERKFMTPVTARPLHSCDEVAARQRSSRWALHRATSDVVRADVEISDSGDVYSWASENRFDDPTLERLLKHGAWSAGDLAAVLSMVFSGQDRIDFAYDGDKMQDGRLVSEYEFHVPIEDSHYRFKLNGVEGRSAYEGRLLADPDRGELIQMTLRTIGLPSSTGICEVSKTFDYAKAALDGQEFVLPVRTLVRFINPDGSESDNLITYANFRKPEPPREEVPAKEPPAPLPPGIPFRMVITRAIHLATINFGDHVHGATASDIKDKLGNVLVPKDTEVEGRVIKLVRVYGDSESKYTWNVIVRWEAMRYRGISRPFTADLMFVQKVRGAADERPILRLQDDSSGPGTSDPIMGGFGGVGLRPDFVFDAGVPSVWKTMAPR
jgi:hypothetical protein